MVIDSIFVYHLVDPDLKVDVIFRKEGTDENGEVDFKMGYRHLPTLVLEVEKNSFFNSFFELFCVA